MTVVSFVFRKGFPLKTVEPELVENIEMWIDATDFSLCAPPAGYSSCAASADADRFNL